MRFAARLAGRWSNEQPTGPCGQLSISSHGATVLKLRFCYIQVQFTNQVPLLGGRITEPSRQQAVDVSGNAFKSQAIYAFIRLGTSHA